MRYIIGFILSIAVLIFIFVLIFSGGGDDPAAPETKKLVDYANSSVEVQLTSSGPINADLSHRVTRTTVGRDASTIDVIQGFQGNTLRSQTYANNEAAYASFLSALDLAGFSQGNKDEALSDERGYCPTGFRYVYEIKDGSQTIQRFWSTSCGGVKTFAGKAEIVRTLFRTQIPDYGRITSEAR